MISVSKKNITFDGLVKLSQVKDIKFMAYLCCCTQKQVRLWQENNNPPNINRRVLQVYVLGINNSLNN